MRISAIHARILLVSGALLAVAPACGGRGTGARDPVVQGSDRLQGNWKVQSFAPESPLDPPLQSLLNGQLGALTIQFSGETFSARGPSLEMVGRFKVWSFANNQLSGTIYDQTGVAYRVAGQFEGASFHFRSFDTPWRGQGTLQRQP